MRRGRRRQRIPTRPDSGRGDAVDVVDGVDAAHRVEHAVEVNDVAHLEHVATERQPVIRRLDRCGEDVDVMLAENARDVRESNPGLSSASTWICTKKMDFVVGAQSTSMILSVCSWSEIMFGQLV